MYKPLVQVKVANQQASERAKPIEYDILHPVQLRNYIEEEILDLDNNYRNLSQVDVMELRQRCSRRQQILNEVDVH